MSDTATVERFWRTFCTRHGIDPGTRHDVFAFGDDPAMQDELLELVLHGPSGRRRASSWSTSSRAIPCRWRGPSAWSSTVRAGRAR